MKIELKYKCEKCGYEPEPNKEKSNKNWTVIDTKCPKCGGRVKINVEDIFNENIYKEEDNK